MNIRQSKPQLSAALGGVAISALLTSGSALAEFVHLEIIHAGFAEGATVTVNVWGADSDGDGILSSVPNDPIFLGSTGGSLTVGDEVSRAELTFSGNSITPAFSATFDRTRYPTFNGPGAYFSVFGHFAYNLDGGPVIGDQANEGAVIGDFDRPGTYAVGQKGLTVNGAFCQMEGLPPADCGMVQFFTAWDPVFDPFQADVDFGDATGTVYRVVRLAGSVLPGIQDNVIRPNSNDTVVVALSSTPELDIAEFDPADVRAGPAKAGPSNWYQADLHDDGQPDLFVEFRARDLGIGCDDDLLEVEVVSLSGEIKGKAYDQIIPQSCGRGQLFPKGRN